MNLTEGIRQSLEVIRGNKIRSFLTMLGINFGVGCLIAISIVGMAFRNSIDSEMGRYGTTLLWVQTNWSAYASREARTFLDGRDIRYFQTALPGLESDGSIFDSTETASWRGNSRQTGIMGVNYSHFDLFSVALEKGRNFLPEDFRLRRAVCILRPDIASVLFPDGDDPLGKIIRLGDRNYTVIGVTERRGQGFVSDGSDNYTIFVPQDLLASRIWGGREIRYWIYLMKFETPADVDLASERIAHYLNSRYGELRGQPRFQISRLDSFVQTVDRVLNIVSMLILVIAVISIVVGGLGIMNIMLVAVTERTREIGVRMAVGARSRDILIQFVIEAITLCLLGGGTGILFGTGLAFIACAALKWRFFVSAGIVLGALGISTTIGLVFGIYPAWKASRLMPIEALRTEL